MCWNVYTPCWIVRTTSFTMHFLTSLIFCEAWVCWSPSYHRHCSLDTNWPQQTNLSSKLKPASDQTETNFLHFLSLLSPETFHQHWQTFPSVNPTKLCVLSLSLSPTGSHSNSRSYTHPPIIFLLPLKYWSDDIYDFDNIRFLVNWFITQETCCNSIFGD